MDASVSAPILLCISLGRFDGVYYCVYDDIFKEDLIIDSENFTIYVD